MPEGPEIWRTATRLGKAIKQKKIEKIYFSFKELSEYEEQLKGTSVQSVEPRGKAIITLFSNGLALYSHNQLYGKWLISKRGNKPETNRKLRVAIHNKENSAYLYSASDIEILTQENISEHGYIKKLGPDVLNPSVTLEDVIDRIKNEEFQNRKLTALLLDQSFLSGIGNYLRSEILFYAGAFPFRKLKSYSEQTKKKLGRAALKLSRRSFETGGITNDPDIVKALKRENADRSEYRHFVYGRSGERCHKCGTVVEEDKSGGRKVFFCPSCQNNPAE